MMVIKETVWYIVAVYTDNVDIGQLSKMTGESKKV